MFLHWESVNFVLDSWKCSHKFLDMSSGPNDESRMITDEMCEEDVAEWLKGKGIPELTVAFSKLLTV